MQFLEARFGHTMAGVYVHLRPNRGHTTSDPSLPTQTPIHMNFVSKTHRYLARRSLLLPGILLGLAATALSAHAGTLVPSTWYSAESAGAPTTDDGIKFTTNSGGFQSMLTHFGPSDLATVGDTLSVSLQFSGELGTNSENSQYPFAFAFYNSGGNQISANELGQNGNRGTGDPSPYNEYRGYRVDVNTARRPSQSPIRLLGRSGEDIALASNNAHTSSFGGRGSAPRTFISNSLYSVNYNITRTDSDTLKISFSVTGEGLTSTGDVAALVYTGEWDIVSSSAGFTTTFDTFAITLSGVNTFDSLTLYHVTISGPAIPEPATVTALMATAALAFLAFRRRQRRR